MDHRRRNSIQSAFNRVDQARVDFDASLTTIMEEQRMQDHLSLHTSIGSVIVVKK